MQHIGKQLALAFVIYVSDLEDCLEFAIAQTYAEETSTSVNSLTIAEVIRRLKIDAYNVLKFMSSNDLVANAAKITFNTLIIIKVAILKISVNKYHYYYY